MWSGRNQVNIFKVHFLKKLKSRIYLPWIQYYVQTLNHTIWWNLCSFYEKKNSFQSKYMKDSNPKKKAEQNTEVLLKLHIFAG